MVSSITIISPDIPLQLELKPMHYCSGSGNLGSIDLEVSGGNSANYQYSWSNGDNSQDISNLTAGLYTVTVSDGSYLAIDTCRIKVENAPVLELGPDQLNCTGTFILLDALNPGASYLWNTGQITQTVSAISGKYKLTVTNSCGNAIDSVIINSDGLPTVWLGEDSTICIGSSISLDALNEGSTYSWQPDSETSKTISKTISANRTYKVTVTTQCGKTAEDEIVFTTKTKPALINAADTSICMNNSIVLSVNSTGADSYLWDTGDTTTSIEVNPSITAEYFVSATNDCGNSIDTIRLEVHELPSFVILPKDSINKVGMAGDTVHLEVSELQKLANEYKYLWDNDQYLTADDIYNPHAILPVGLTVFNVIVTDQNSCSDSDSITLTGISKELRFYNLFTPNGDGYNDFWHIDNLQWYPENKISIFDRLGGLIYETDSYHLHEWDGKYKGKLAPTTTYYFVLELKGDFEKVITGDITIMR
jgi:gliding motility-associated-like protein